MPEVNARAMKDLRGFFAPAQVEAMIESCDNLRDRVLIRLLWRTGMRISELVRPGQPRQRPCPQCRKPAQRYRKTIESAEYWCNECQFMFIINLGLRVENILWGENALIIRHAKRKGNPPRRIDVDPETLAIVRDYLNRRVEKSEFVIPIGRQMGYLVVRQAAERIGITEVGDPLVSKRRHPHPHHLSHSLAVHSVRVTKGNYADLIRLQSQLGHASVATTAGYVQFSDEEQRGWYDKLWKEKQ